MKKLILRPHFNVALALVCYWTFVAPGMSGSEKTTNSDLTGELTSFHQKTEKERSAIIDEDSKKLNRLYEALLKKLRFGNDEDKFYASFILGEYRFADAAADLAKNISLDDAARIDEIRSKEWYWYRYPAVEALVRIGSPAIPAVMQNLTELDDKKIKDLSLKVIVAIDRDKDITQLRLKKAIAAQSDAVKKARLQSALQTLSDPKIDK